jgi:peptidoglycan hydrolase CwlO-like protein
VKRNEIKSLKTKVAELSRELEDLQDAVENLENDIRIRFH